MASTLRGYGRVTIVLASQHRCTHLGLLCGLDVRLDRECVDRVALEEGRALLRIRRAGRCRLDLTVSLSPMSLGLSYGGTGRRVDQIFFCPGAAIETQTCARR